MAFHYFGDPFGEPILEDRPLATNPSGIAFHYFGDPFGQPILEVRPLVTNPFGIAFAKSWK